MQVRIRLAFWATRIHSWLMSHLPSTSTPRSFSAGLCSMASSPSCYWWWGLPWLRYNTLHLDLLNLVRFSWAHCSSCLDLSGWHLVPVVSRVHPQLGVISKLAEGALDPTVYVINKGVVEHWSLIRRLGNTTHYSPPGHRCMYVHSNCLCTAK